MFDRIGAAFKNSHISLLNLKNLTHLVTSFNRSSDIPKEIIVYTIDLQMYIHYRYLCFSKWINGTDSNSDTKKIYKWSILYSYFEFLVTKINLNSICYVLDLENRIHNCDQFGTKKLFINQGIKFRDIILFLLFYQIYVSGTVCIILIWLNIFASFRSEIFRTFR